MLGKVKVILQERINRKNRSKLTNLSPSLVCSNCTGGFYIIGWVYVSIHRSLICI